MNFGNNNMNGMPTPMGAPAPMGAPQPMGAPTPMGAPAPMGGQPAPMGAPQPMGGGISLGRGPVTPPPMAPAPAGGVISLRKGEKIDLSKSTPALKRAMIGLGWDPIGGMVGAQFDLDASCFLLDANGRANGIQDFIFYNNLVGGNGSVQHQGDNLTGDGDGDDEQILIEFDRVPANIAKIAITITIDQYDVRRQNFGMVRNAFARVVDNDSQRELIRFDLGEDFSTETAIIAVEFYRHNGAWKMSAVAQGYAGGLAALARSYGLNVG